jgi:homoserine kinase type II
VQLASIGVTLAEYHRAICGFAAPPGQAQPRYSPQAILALMEQLLEWDVMGDLHDPLAWYTSRAVELRAALPEAAYAALPHTVIHGDIHCDNLRFRGDQVAGLLDYDQVAWDARAVDLADALVAFASVPMAASTWGVFLGPLDCARAACLLNSYARVAPLTAAEAAQIPTLVELLWLQGELGRVRSTPEGAPDYHRSVLEQGRLLSAWMRDHYEALCMPGTGLAEVTGGMRRSRP